MMEAQVSVKSEPPTLAGARADFVASIGRRLATLREAVDKLRAEPNSEVTRDMLLRRLHALGSAASVLGFDETAEALSQAEVALHQSDGVSSEGLSRVLSVLEEVPSLLWGASSSVEPAEPNLARDYPMCVLVFGADELSSGLSAGTNIEVESEDNAELFVEQARAIAPDTIIVDADQEEAEKLVRRLNEDPSDRTLPPARIG